MLKMNLEYKKGILFIKLNGNLNDNTSSSFMDYIMPIIEKYEVKHLVVNINNVEELDAVGFDSLLTLKSEMFKSRGNILFIDEKQNNKIKLENLMSIQQFNV